MSIKRPEQMLFADLNTLFEIISHHRPRLSLLAYVRSYRAGEVTVQKSGFLSQSPEPYSCV